MPKTKRQKRDEAEARQIDYDALLARVETLEAQLATCQRERDDLSRAYTRAIGPVIPASQ